MVLITVFGLFLSGHFFTGITVYSHSISMDIILYVSLIVDIYHKSFTVVSTYT